jgi:hypothetical protein
MGICVGQCEKCCTEDVIKYVREAGKELCEACESEFFERFFRTETGGA